MKTKIKNNIKDPVSILGFGGGHLPECRIKDKIVPDQEKINQLLSYAVEHGINYFDTAPLYLNGYCEQAVGEGLKYYRKEVFIAGKLQGEESKRKNHLRALERTLKNLQTDYLDYYYLWGINQYFFDDFIVKNSILEDLAKMKEQGVIRHIAFSFHGQPEEIKNIIDGGERLGIPFDACLVQYNLLDQKNEQMITYAKRKGLTTFAMGPGAGGRLAVPSNLYARMTGRKPMATYELALRFVMENSDMDCTLSGMENMKMLVDNISIAEKMDENATADYESIKLALKQLKKFSELYCTGCRYCQPCPVGIKIHDIFKCYTYHNVYGLSGYAKGAYLKYLSDGGKNCDDCLKCGKCEERCPQKLSIREELRHVDSILRGISDKAYEYNPHDHGEYL